MNTSQFSDKSSSDLQFYGLCHGLPSQTRVAKVIRYGRLNKPAAVSWITEKGSDYVQGGTCWPAAGRCRSVIPEKSSAGRRRRANEAACAPRQCLLNPQLLRPGCQCWPLRWKRKGSQWLFPTCSVKIQSANHLKRNVRGEQGLASFQGMSFRFHQIKADLYCLFAIELLKYFSPYLPSSQVPVLQSSTSVTL